MSIVSLLLAVGGAVLAATLFIMFIAIIMAFTQINIPEKCKNCPLLFSRSNPTIRAGKTRPLNNSIKIMDLYKPKCTMIAIL